MAPYHYKALEPDQIRVLEILETETLFRSRLVHHNDSDSSEYHALSYAWGVESCTEAIECDGEQVLVTPHLLEGLRSIYATTGISSIWVDAICINQNDDEEKALQVAKMHSIYRNAASVVVWLGASQDNSDIAMDAIMQGSLLEQPEIPKDDNEALISVLRHSETAPALFDPSTFTPLARLSDRSWFRRLWIAQEYFFACKVLFCCGRKTVPGDNFIKSLRGLSIHSFGREIPQDLRNEDRSQLWVGFRMLTELHRLKDEPNRLSFFELVLHGRKRHVKEPVDRLYAIYGMAEDSDERYWNGIPIDYSTDNRRDYWIVFATFAKLALLHEPHLRLLSVVDSISRPKELPSWCPNLNSTSSTDHMMGHYEAGWPTEGNEVPRNCPNFASKDERHFTFSSSGKVMEIWGARIDFVSLIQQDLMPTSEFDRNNIATAKHWASSMLKWLKSCEKFCERAIQDPKEARLIWNETMVGTGNDPDKRAKNSDLIPYMLMEKVLDEIISLDARSSMDKSSVLQTFLGPTLLWISTIQDQWESRVLFATTDGKLGYASNKILQGDQVCMFYGGRLIYILRGTPAHNTRKKQFQFASEAYLFNHMDGEVFDMLREGILKEEQFSIV
jgi:hypothetical protein